jgi:GT2 family glycosyltransferase
MLVSVLIPYLPDRLGLLDAVESKFHETLADVDHELVTVTGGSWGDGLNRLASIARGAYWLCACDDIAPDHGWFEAARVMVDEGLTPATRYYDVAGQPLRAGVDDAPHGTPIAWCRSFLLTPAIFTEIGPFIDATWWADIDYSERLTESGRPVTACDGFTFTHLDGPRDWLTDEEHERQRVLYEQRPAGRVSAVPWSDPTVQW